MPRGTFLRSSIFVIDVERDDEGPRRDEIAPDGLDEVTVERGVWVEGDESTARARLGGSEEKLLAVGEGDTHDWLMPAPTAGELGSVARERLEPPLLVAVGDRIDQRSAERHRGVAGESCGASSCFGGGNSVCSARSSRPCATSPTRSR